VSNEQLLNQEAEGIETDFPAHELPVAREQLGLTKSDVARELRLSEKYIDSLERGAFNELPSMVFARGYVQSYTRLLKLDTKRYLDLFDRLYGRTGAGAAPQFRIAPGVQSTAKLGDPVIKWSAWIFIMVIVAATVWWWKTQQGEGQPVSQMPAAQSVEVESVDGSTLIVPSGITEESDAQGGMQARLILLCLKKLLRKKALLMPQRIRLLRRFPLNLTMDQKLWLSRGMPSRNLFSSRSSVPMLHCGLPLPMSAGSVLKIIPVRCWPCGLSLLEVNSVLPEKHRLSSCLARLKR